MINRQRGFPRGYVPTQPTPPKPRLDPKKLLEAYYKQRGEDPLTGFLKGLLPQDFFLNTAVFAFALVLIFIALWRVTGSPVPAPVVIGRK